MKTILLCSLLFTSAMSGCGGGAGATSSPSNTPPAQAAAPTFSPAPGIYSNPQTVTIASTTSGAAVYYTTDGSAPTTASTPYSGAISVSATTPLRAIAELSGGPASKVSTGFYAVAGSPGTPAYTWKNVQIIAGGFITGIVAHPAQPGLMYARTDIGGAYRWDTVNGRWIPLTDWIPMPSSNNIGIESIGIDPSDPNRLYLAVGTYTESWAGNGAILVSDDQGNTFTTVPMPFKMGSNDNGREAGERLAVDPNDGSIVYFGSRQNGLWKSGDHGLTWNQVSGFPVTGPTTGLKNDGVGVIFIDFVQSSGSVGTPTPVIYAGVSDTGTEATPVYGLYRSTDGGTTWSAVPNQPTGLYPNHGVFGPDGSLYLSYGDDVGPNGMSSGAIYKYTPPANSAPAGAGAWTNITPPAPTYSSNGNAGFGIVAVDPERPGTIMASSMDLWWLHDDIWRSTDGGATWEQPEVGANSVYDGSLSPYINQLQLGGGTNNYPGWWIGAMAIDPFNSGHALYGTGATIWSTSDLSNADSGTTVHWAVGANGIEETAVLRLISPPSGANLVSGVGDIGGFVHTSLTASPATGMMSNPVFTTTTGLDFAQQAPAVMARTGYAGNTSQTGGYSTNGGTSWTPFASQPAGTSKGAGSIAVSADGTRFVWAPVDAAVAYTADNGSTWIRSNGAPSPGSSSLNVIADRVNPKTFYILTSTGLYTSTDGGASFALTNAAPPANGTLISTPALEGDLWLSSGSGLFHSTDGGNSFTVLPNVQSAGSTGFGAPASGETYPALYLMGTVNNVTGYFRSLDGGATWTQINDAQHGFGNGSLVIGDPRVFGRIYIGTNGRGILYGDSAH